MHGVGETEKKREKKNKLKLKKKQPSMHQTHEFDCGDRLCELLWLTQNRKTLLSFSSICYILLPRELY